ncbi:MAG: methyltransferase domain-containing protein [Planctomycetota bacterium]
MTREELESRIRELGPWHHDIQLTDELSTGGVFSPDGTLKRVNNEGVSLISPRTRFHAELKTLFPRGMKGKRFLDCACNAGGYCFWATEFGADHAVGFDVREHWINQGLFVKEHRTVAPVDNVNLQVMDLYDFPKVETEDFDMTYFSGIFYHLPDPVTGLKIAADRTRDILVLNTAMMPKSSEDEESQLAGMTLSFEGTEQLMSGVHRLSWLPNNPQTLVKILRWLGFEDVFMTIDKTKTLDQSNFKGGANPQLSKRRRRIGYYAAREKGRLKEMRRQLKTAVVDKDEE